ncbi:putative integral membrane domain protein [Mycobacterium xenopi 4042]|uniref:Putative integral membrane domain protein n=1 Tax=Mycobacterium xenopi 4042 TaxID=1299334 RepID=X7ZBS3_MYCXE|nr:putative integral membrane domain protein [Mycobacterium xenopi 4042]
MLVPGPPSNSVVAQWNLGSEPLGRPGCAEAPDGVHCAASMALTPEEQVGFSRTLTVPRPMSVTPRVWVRPRQGPQLADLIAEPDTVRAAATPTLSTCSARHTPPPTEIRRPRGRLRSTSCSTRRRPRSPSRCRGPRR